jgi:hypothetical protein
MYIWRVEPLKRELRAGPMPSSRVLPYIIALSILLTLVAQLPLLVPLPNPNKWDVVNGLSSVVLTLGGLLAVYRANGGPEGLDFAARLLALGWVIGWRLVPAFILLSLVALAIDPDQFISEAAPTGPALVALTLSFQLVYYWRLWVHFRDLRHPV